MLQRFLWTEVSKLDSRVINITLDELFRAAIDGGISSRRCEAVSEALVVMSSINVRGRVLAKLRRVSLFTSTAETKVADIATPSSRSLRRRSPDLPKHLSRTRRGMR